MPTYVYRCRKCEHEFETFQRMTDEPIKECPECKGEVGRLLFPPGIVFKGSGFHVNDYPSSGSRSSSSPARKEDEPKPADKETSTAAKS